MELSELIKEVRQKTIRECQRVIVMHPDDDRYYLSAKLSDMKLFRPDSEIETLIKEYEKCNSKKRTSNTSREDSRM